MFGFNINLSKQTPKDKPNFQFVLDAFASKDTVQKKNNLDLRINSLLIRRGKVSYDVLSEKETPGKFNPQHLRLRNIIANISLKALQNDSINAAIKRLSIEEEHSGFELKKLSLKVIGNDQRMKIENFAIDLPNTSLAMDTIHMDYDSLGAFDNLAQDVRFSFHLLPSQIALQDLSAFVPAFGSFKEKLQVEVQTDGTINQLNCPHLSVSVGNHFYLRETYLYKTFPIRKMLMYSVICPICTQTRKELPLCPEFQQELQWSTSRPATLRNGFLPWRSLGLLHRPRNLRTSTH